MNEASIAETQEKRTAIISGTSLLSSRFYSSSQT